MPSLGKGQPLSAFPRGHCFQGILSCLFPTISSTREEVQRPPLLQEPALSPGTASRIRLLPSDCFTWPALNELGSEKCCQSKFPWQPLYTPRTVHVDGLYHTPTNTWNHHLSKTPEITIYQILTGKSNQNWHFQDRFPGCSSSYQPTTRFLDFTEPKIKATAAAKGTTEPKQVWLEVPHHRTLKVICFLSSTATTEKQVIGMIVKFLSSLGI